MGLNVTDMGLEKKDNNKKELKKHAATIHCSNTLSLLQRKVTNALLYHAYKELMLKDEHEITVKQLCRLIGYAGNNHAVIKDALKVLISTVIEWNLIDDKTGNENWSASSILASVSLEGPLCYYAYSPRMKQLLHSPSMFGKIDLVIQSHFRSSYGLALYENCIRYRGLPHTKWMEMNLFKKLMGVPAGKYDIFRDFKRRVLDKAIEEVNMYSDLFIEAEFVREGRKVAKVRFTLKDRAKRTRLGGKRTVKPVALNPEQSELHEKLFNTFGMTPEQVEGLLSEFEHTFVNEKITLVEASKPFKDGKIQNVAAYLISAVKNNYQPATKQKKEKVIDLKAVLREQEISSLKKLVEAVRNDYIAYRERTIHAAIDSLKRTKKKKFFDEFYRVAEPAINTILHLQRNKYSRENVLESPQIKALLRQFALRELDLLSIASLEEYVAQLDEEKVISWQKMKSLDPDHPLLRFVE